jgi:hypothetical protein
MKLHSRIGDYPYPETFDFAGKCLWVTNTLPDFGQFVSYEENSVVNTVSRGCTLKTFYSRNFCRIALNKSLCHCHSLPPKSDICGQGLEPTKVELLTWLHSIGWLLGLSTNIRLRWKWKAVANTLDYHNTVIITALKSFIVQTLKYTHVLFVEIQSHGQRSQGHPRPNVTELFTGAIY